MASLLRPALSPPSQDTMVAAWLGLSGCTRQSLLTEWTRLAPCPLYYTFPLSLTAHPFLCLGSFRAGRIHQVRAQGRYRAANPSGSGMDGPQNSTRCCTGHETFSHPILRCKSTAPDREPLLKGLADVGLGLRPYRHIASVD